MHFISAPQNKLGHPSWCPEIRIMVTCWLPQTRCYLVTQGCFSLWPSFQSKELEEMFTACVSAFVEHPTSIAQHWFHEQMYTAPQSQALPATWTQHSHRAWSGIERDVFLVPYYFFWVITSILLCPYKLPLILWVTVKEFVHISWFKFARVEDDFIVTTLQISFVILSPRRFPSTRCPWPNSWPKAYSRWRDIMH